MEKDETAEKEKDGAKRTAVDAAPVVVPTDKLPHVAALNLNDYVWVRLREPGRTILRERDERWSRLYGVSFGRLAVAEKQEAENGGWSRWQLWSLIEELGHAIHLGSNVPFETTLRLAAPQSEAPNLASPVSELKDLAPEFRAVINENIATLYSGSASPVSDDVERLKGYAKHSPGCCVGKPRPECPNCGAQLARVRQSANSMLNEYQFDAVKAGDYYCTSCRGEESHSTTHKYWWERDLTKHSCSCGLDALIAALSRASASAQRQEDQGAALLPADQSAAVTTEPLTLPHSRGHVHNYELFHVCRVCGRTEADINGGCHHCDDFDSVKNGRCWWCLRAVGSGTPSLSEASASPHRSAAQDSSSSSSSPSSASEEPRS